MDSKTTAIVGTSFIAGVLCAGLAYKLFKHNQKLVHERNVQSKDNKQINNKDIRKNNQKINPSNYQLDQQYMQIKNEQVARIIKFFGQQKYKKLQNSFVVVFGVGGVGSHAVNMLARSGVKRIRIVDFDTVSISSLNRHSFALREDVGTLKVDCLKKYINKIFPHITIQCVNHYVTVQNVRTLLSSNYQQILKYLQNKQQIKIQQNEQIEKPDYIVDCIDNLDAKVQLIAACIEKKLKLIVSGGAGMKNDPTKIQIRDISDCKYDKLIMRIKRQLTKKQIKSGVKVVFSYQQAEKQLLPLTQTQQQNPHAFKVFDNYRIRIVPVLGTMPAIIGMAIASYVLCELAGQPYEPFQTDYVKSSTIGKIFNQLQYESKKRGIQGQNFQVDVQQVSILSKKVYNWKCLINPQKKGDRLAVWDRSKPVTIENLALMTKQNCQKHMKALKLQDLAYSEQIVNRFVQKSKQSKRIMDHGYMMFI